MRSSPTKGTPVTDFADHAHRLSELLGLTAAPVAVTFGVPSSPASTQPVPAQPAGCCFWQPAEHERLDTVAADHANCSVGSYTHGLIPLAQAAAGEDTAALPFTPSSITYQPLAEAEDPDVVLARLSPAALMTLLGAAPDLRLAGKPQCTIVPLAQAGQVAVSPGCAVSRTRTGLPSGELTGAIPARKLESILERLESATAADRAVSAFAAADIASTFSTA